MAFPDDATPFRPGLTDAPRRLLLVSYHFPPSQAVGALRWQKMAGHLAEQGWALDVITLPPGALTSREIGRLKDLPPSARVWGVREHTLLCDWLALRGIRALRVLGAALERIGKGITRFVRAGPPPVRSPEAAQHAAAATPHSFHRDDPRLSRLTLDGLVRAYDAWRVVVRERTWGRNATRLAARLASSARWRAVITCGPPHMVHHHGATLARKLGVPLVMDLRDPWSLVERLPAHMASPLWFALAKRFERRAVRSATLVVTNTEPARAAMAAAHPEAAPRCITVLNGHDEEPIPPPPPGRRFVLAYAGTIYLDRDPRLLLRAARRWWTGCASRQTTSASRWLATWTATAISP